MAKLSDEHKENLRKFPELAQTPREKIFLENRRLAFCDTASRLFDRNCTGEVTRTYEQKKKYLENRESRENIKAEHPLIKISAFICENLLRISARNVAPLADDPNFGIQVIKGVFTNVGEVEILGDAFERRAVTSLEDGRRIEGKAARNGALAVMSLIIAIVRVASEARILDLWAEERGVKRELQKEAKEADELGNDDFKL